MKVLFAVSNEEISESIVKRYQREYKEIISYKNVYYFNAILKELQKDKSYDRIVISEDLEAFTNTQYDQIDKFIFDKLDSISDEASNFNGEDIPIILICSDRREKAEEMLIKLFGIGVYNALIGNDRSADNVCKLLNKPRLKKEAKTYYRIDSDDVSYQSENENDVSEVEIQNILTHYKRLGKDEKKYVESFENIAQQYNDVQLRIICKFLPLNVRAVLEEQSPKYQQIISFNSRVSDNLRAQSIKQEKAKSGTSERLLNIENSERILSKPVIIPSAVNMNGNRKMARIKNEPKEEIQNNNEKQVKEVRKIGPLFDEKEEIEDILSGVKPQEIKSQEIKPQEEKVQEVEEKIAENIEIPEQPKRGRGRPRKNPVPEENSNQPKRGRGRPRKNPVPENQEKIEDMILPGFEETTKHEENTTIPEIEERPIRQEENESILPGFEDINVEKHEEYNDDNMTLPGLENFEEKEESVNTLPGLQDYPNNRTVEDVDISRLLTSDKKVACFIGTTKNGTSFIVNNLAKITSSTGIDTAILDTTKNRNSYYIYTKNEEPLRKVAMNCVKDLVNGVAEGIQVNKNLTVYTSLPDETEGIENAGAILQTLLQKHSLVLIDCDFDTPIEYFNKIQEIYLVQTFDILTIQPLTAFLRELKSKNILDENKLKIVLNKAVKLRGINEKTIIGGMSNYNDPAMSFMTELFDKNIVKYITIPFSEEVYTRYMENVINCEISVKGYPKNIMQILNELANIVYPLVSNKSTYVPPKVERSTFTPSINSTLDQMKKRY